MTVNKKTTPKVEEPNPLGEHYAHLDKHVKEVRRGRNKNLVCPKMSDFQVKKGDKIISTKWIEFVEAVNIYFF
jgi:hypothetical protein